MTMFAGPAGVGHVAAVAVVGPVPAAVARATTLASEVRALAPTFLARRRCGANSQPPPMALPTLPVCAPFMITVVCVRGRRGV